MGKSMPANMGKAMRNLPEKVAEREVAAANQAGGLPRQADNKVAYRAGEHLFREGEQSDYAYLIEEGTVCLTKDTGNGPIPLGRVRAGGLLGEMGIIDGKNRSASALAETDVVAIRLDVASFLARMESEPEFSADIVNRLIGNLREANDQLAHQHFLKARMEERARGNAAKGKARADESARRRFGLFAKSRDFLEFQPDAVEIEQQHFPKIAKLTLYLIFGFFGLAIGWASVAQIDTAVISQGQIATTVPNIVVQPVETAMILEMKAREGDLVEKGQVLATLDSTFAEADVQASRSTFVSVAAQERRLLAELSGEEPERFSPDKAVNALQKEIFQRRTAEYEANLSSLSERQSQLEADIAINRQDAADIAQQVAVLRELEAMRQRLLDSGHGNRVQFLNAKNDRLFIEREERRLVSLRQRLLHEAEAAKQNREAFVSERRSAIAQELVAVRREREELSEVMKKLERRQSMVSLSAPAKGIVLEIAERSEGSVIQQAEPLFTIVPVDVALEMEAQVAPRDVGEIKVGDPVRIKLDALPFQKFGTLEGRVSFISEDTVAGEDRNAGVAYRAKVEIVNQDLQGVPADFRLIPGMTGTAEITVGKRRIITYFFYPIVRALDSSFRDP